MHCIVDLAQGRRQCLLVEPMVLWAKPLCTELRRKGQSVRAAVRSATRQVENVETVSVGEINGETDWTDALFGVKVVIHFAARVHVMKDNALDPLDGLRKVNVEGAWISRRLSENRVLGQVVIL